MGGAVLGPAQLVQVVGAGGQQLVDDVGADGQLADALELTWLRRAHLNVHGAMCATSAAAAARGAWPGRPPES